MLTVVGFDFLVLIHSHILRSKIKNMHHFIPKLEFCSSCYRKHSLS